MAQNLKPVIDELKAKFANREQIRDTVLEKIKTVAEQAKDSKLVHDYVIPAVESEKADQAMKFLNEKLGTNALLTKLEQARQKIIDLKVAKAKPAQENSEQAAPTEQPTPESDASAETETNAQ